MNALNIENKNYILMSDKESLEVEDFLNFIQVLMNNHDEIGSYKDMEISYEFVKEMQECWKEYYKENTDKKLKELTRLTDEINRVRQLIEEEII